MARSEILKRDEQGFTLMEIVAVLILVGILASWAAPKFFDMQAAGEMKAAEAAVAETQVRINTIFSKAMYAGSSCPNAQEAVTTALPSPQTVNGFTLTFGTLSTGGTAVTVKRDNVDVQLSPAPTLKLPTCETTGGSSAGTSVCSDKKIAAVAEVKTVTETVEVSKGCPKTDVGTFYGAVTCSCDADGNYSCEGPKKNQEKQDAEATASTNLTSYQNTYSKLMSLKPLVVDFLGDGDFKKYTSETIYKCNKSTTLYSCSRWWNGFCYGDSPKVENAGTGCTSTAVASVSTKTISLKRGMLVQSAGNYYVVLDAFEMSSKDDFNSSKCIKVTAPVINASDAEYGNVYLKDKNLYVWTGNSKATAEPESNGWLKIESYSSSGS